MFGMGAGELILVLVIALLVFGPKKLPELARGMGKALREFRRASSDIQEQLAVDEEIGPAIREVQAAVTGLPAPSDIPREDVPLGRRHEMTDSLQDSQALGGPRGSAGESGTGPGQASEENAQGKASAVSGNQPGPDAVESGTKSETGPVR